MKKFYFTFGMCHVDSKGNSLAGCYTTIKAKDYFEARKIMNSSPLGNQWAFQYNTADEAGVRKFNLQFIQFKDL
jgi:hypothetical protein